VVTVAAILSTAIDSPYLHVWSSVDSQLRVRVTDAALSRDLFPADYDQHGGGESESRPTRWMALESLVDRRASSASDMVRYSFAVNRGEDGSCNR